MIRDTLPPDVLAMLKAGNKIEAIKQLRGMTGLGLKGAKDRIESYERGAVAPSHEFGQPSGRSSNASFTLPAGALDALRGGNTIEAIRIVRESTGVGLAEAKSFVEEIGNSLASLRPAATATRTSSTPMRAPPGLSPGEVARAGGAGKWFALIAVAAVALFAAFYP